MEKTINCADCGVQVTYNEKPGFPRKYCQVHSNQRRASFKHASESKPTHTPQGEAIGEKSDTYPGKQYTEDVPVEKIPPVNTHEAYMNGKKDGQKECHLAIEHTRSNALASALEGYKIDGKIPEKWKTITDMAKNFEKYILGDDE